MGRYIDDLALARIAAEGEGDSRALLTLNPSERTPARKFMVRQGRCGAHAVRRFPLLRPSAQSSHVGLDSGLIKEDQAVRIRSPLDCTPPRPVAGLVPEEPANGVMAYQGRFQGQQILEPVGLSDAASHWLVHQSNSDTA